MRKFDRHFELYFVCFVLWIAFLLFWFYAVVVLRGQSDKYLASPPDGVTIARKIYYRVVHSRRRLLPKFQPNRTRSFVLTACGIGRVRGFQKNGHRLPGEGQNGHRADSPPNCRKYGPIWRRKKCSSIMTTHRFTLPPSPRPNWSNWATNCYPIHHNLQIWPRVTSFCFQTGKSHSLDRNLRWMRSSSPPLRPILQTSRKRIFQTG